MGKKIVQKGGGNNIAVAATTTTTTTTPVTTTVNTNNVTPKSKTLKNIATTFFGSIGVYGVMFVIFYSCGVPFGWSTFLGFGLGMMVFAYIDSNSPGSPEYSKPILLLMLILLISSLSIHYLPKTGANNSDTELIPESGTISEVDQFWATAKNFKQGDSIDVKISGGPVKLNKSNQLLKQGVYTLPILSDGNLIFRGVSNTSVKIEVKE